MLLLLAIVFGILFGKFLATGLLVTFTVISALLTFASFSSKDFMRLTSIAVALHAGIFNICMWVTYFIVSPADVSGITHAILR
ncbi:MAG: hypothetical protein NTX72_03135 [Candidatus Uhrbacteria bacterium]|nr:hypothetical protein [Candidatus Uhrbacteria bacterium]